MFVYLAGPIDSASEEARLAVTQAADGLRRAGIPFFSPRSAWSVNGTAPPALAPALSGVNEHAITASKLVLAVVVGSSIGVPAELQFARMVGTPAVVIAPHDLVSKSIVLRHLATAGLYTDLAYALKQVRDLMVQGEPGVKVAHVAREVDVQDLPLPKQSKPGDIGLDLFVSDDITIPAGEWRGVPSRIRVAPPSDIWFLIAGRSSTLHKRGLIIPQSVIDVGYRGPLFALAFNITKTDAHINRGDRIAQLIPLPHTRLEFVEVDVLPVSVRGDSGFGSTGD